MLNRLKIIKKSRFGSYGSLIKNALFSSRGFNCNSQHSFLVPHRASEAPAPSCDLIWSMNIDDIIHLNIHVCAHTETHTQIKVFYINLLCMCTYLPALLHTHVSNMLDSVLSFCHVGSEELRSLGLPCWALSPGIFQISNTKYIVNVYSHTRILYF